MLSLNIYVNYKIVGQSSHESYLFYGIDTLRDIFAPNELPIKVTDVYFPKIASCQFLTHGPGGDINVNEY